MQTAKLTDFHRMTQAIAFLNEKATEQPGLKEVAAAIGLSPSHCQRLFQRYTGISPKRFLQQLTLSHAKRLLREECSVLEASLETGLSSPSRLHDHFVSLDAVTPGEYRSRGLQLTIEYGVANTRFGKIFLAATERGVCCLRFVDDENVAGLIRELKQHWEQARLLANPDRARELAAEIFRKAGRAPLSVFVQGSNFQIKVWQALLAIPPGDVTSYGRLAQVIGSPGAARAVGGAVGANPIAFLIPCHRVIRGDGALGGYRWGEARKQLLLAEEAECFR